MKFSRAKADFVHLKNTLSLNLKLVPADAMLLVNHAWDKSLARATNDKKQIADRGWNPHNRVLLENPETRATIVSDEKLEELNMPIHCKNNEKDETNSLSEDAPFPSVNEDFLGASDAISSTKFNFKSGFASECF